MFMPSIMRHQVAGDQNDANKNAYHIAPYDYYVHEYFLAKSLSYVLGYAKDDILFQVALDEASVKFKTSKADITKHVNLILKR